MNFDLKVSAHRSKVTHWGHGSTPRNFTALCGSGSVSTGSRAATQFLRSAMTDEVTCRKCVKLQTESAPAAEEPSGLDAVADSLNALIDEVTAPAEVEADRADCGNCGQRIQKGRFVGMGWDAATHIATGYRECDLNDADSPRAVPAPPAPAVRKGEERNGSVYLHEGVRAYVFTFKGRDGRSAQVIFDRYGMQSDQFRKYGRSQLTSNALGSIMQAYGTEWLDTYSVLVDELH